MNAEKNIIVSLKKINSKIKLLTLINKAKIEFDKNNYAGAASICEDILSDNPHNALALRCLGCVMQNIGNKEDAINYYKKALKYSDNKEIEYTLLGTIHYLDNELDDAIRYYNLAIDTNDDYDTAYEGRNQAILERHIEIVELQDLLSKQFFKN